MDKPGRAVAIAEMICLHGPHKATQLVKLIDAGRHEDAMALALWNRQPEDMPASGSKERDDG